MNSMKAVLFSCLFYSTISWSCTMDEKRIHQDVEVNSRLFSDFDDSIVMRLEQILEDRFFDRPRKSKEQCPDRVIRLYRFYGQDGLRFCHGVIRAEVRGLTYEVLYRNCGAI